MDDMIDSSLSTTVTDVQCDRAVEYLQRVYTSGVPSDGLSEQRLGMALTAQIWVGLDASLQGLVRVADVLPSVPAAQHPVHKGMQNLAIGSLHLVTLPTTSLAPIITRTLASPRSCIAAEASCTMCFQFSTLICGVIAIILVFSDWAPPVLLLLGFVAQDLMTLWLAIRSVTGEKSTAVIERFMLMRPPKDRRWCRVNYIGSRTTQERMTGSDLGDSPRRSGPRIRAYLVNATWEPISVNSNRTGFTLVA